MKSVLIVCEAGAGNGLGHFYRSVALAQILADNYQITVLSNGANLPDCDVNLISVESFEQFQSLPDYELVILDGYEFPLSVVSVLTQNNIPFIEISDFEKPIYPTKYWINSSVNKQNIPGLGLNYSLLRKEILEVAQTKEFKPQNTNSLFIAFGGTDEQSHSLSVVKKLVSTAFFSRIGVLYLKTGKDFSALEKLKSEHPQLEIFSNLSTQELIKTVDDFSVALVTSSTIACEMVALRKIVSTCWLYENQRLLHFQLIENNAAIDTDLQKLISDPQTFIQKISELPDQQALFEHQKKLIDGNAAERIRTFISNCFE